MIEQHLFMIVAVIGRLSQIKGEKIGGEHGWQLQIAMSASNATGYSISSWQLKQYSAGGQERS